jgi:MFS family permease
MKTAIRLLGHLAASNKVRSLRTYFNQLIAVSMPALLLVLSAMSLWILYWDYPQLSKIPAPGFPMLELSPVGAGIAAATMGIPGVFLQTRIFKGRRERLLAAVALCLWCLIGVTLILTYGFVPPLIRLPDSVVGLMFAFFLVAAILPWLSWLLRPDPKRLNPEAFKRRRSTRDNRSKK